MSILLSRSRAAPNAALIMPLHVNFRLLSPRPTMADLILSYSRSSRKFLHLVVCGISVYRCRTGSWALPSPFPSWPSITRPNTLFSTKSLLPQPPRTSSYKITSMLIPISGIRITVRTLAISFTICAFALVVSAAAPKPGD
jgi:hypothetical protein